MNASVWFALLVAAFAGQCLAGGLCPTTHYAADTTSVLTMGGSCTIQSLHIERNATFILTGTSLTVTCSIYINESAKLVLIPADLTYPMNVTVGGNVILTDGVIEFHHLHLFVSGMVGLYGDSRLIGDGNGWAGGTSTTPAECPKGTPAAAGSAESGGDGGSHATLGGKGANHDIPVAVTYDGANTTWYELSPGCGGAGANGDGGRGGGALAVVAQSFFCCECTVSANGADSPYDITSNGGGGAGGSIFISALNVSAYSGGTFTANGGTSCGEECPGGGGSGGVIRFSYGCSFHDVSDTFTVAYGTGSDPGTEGYCQKDNSPITDVPPSTCPTHNRIMTCAEYRDQGFVSGSSSGGDYTSSDSSLNSYQCPSPPPPPPASGTTSTTTSGTSSASSESTNSGSESSTAATDSTSSSSSTTSHTTATNTQGTNAATGSATATATQSSTSTTTAASATSPTASTASTASASATAGSAGSGSGSASAGGLSGTTAADALNPSGGASSPPSSGNGLLIPIVAGVAGALVLVCIIGAVVVARRRKNPRRGRRESEFVDAGGAHLDSVNNKRASFYSGSGTLEGKHQESLIDGASAQGSTRTGEARPSSLATMKSTFVSDGVTSDGPTFKNGQPPPPSSGRSGTHSDAPTMKSSLTGGANDLTRDDPTYRNGQPPPHMTVDAPTMKSSLGSNGTHINDAPTMKSSLGGSSQMGDAPTMKSTLGSASDPPTVRSQLGDAPTMKSSLGGSGFAGGDPPMVRSVLEGDEPTMKGSLVHLEGDAPTMRSSFHAAR